MIKDRYCEKCKTVWTACGCPREREASCLSDATSRSAYEQAFECWCFLGGRGTLVPESRTQFEEGLPIQVEPQDLIAFFEQNAGGMARGLAAQKPENLTQLFCIREWVTKEQGKSFARWLKHPAKYDEGKMHLMRSEVMREVARKITREIRKQNAESIHPESKP